MRDLASYVCGQWTAGKGRAATLVNPATEEAIAHGVDRGRRLRRARSRSRASAAARRSAR